MNPYTDDTLMPFGKHKGVPLCRLSASYLHWLWTQKPLSDKKLQDYIEDNISALKLEHPDGIWT